MRILYLFILSISVSSWGQGENNYWYFGSTGVGLNFQNGASTINPTPLSNGITQYVYSSSDDGNSAPFATASDSFGNLLFYSDGLSIYNKLHQLMDGCPTAGNSNLVGNYVGSNQSIIVPVPGATKKYYLFSTGSQIIISYNYQRNYSMTTIDFNINPLGQVTSHNDSILLPYIVEGYQALTATYNQNQNGYLLIIPKGTYSGNGLNELLVFNVSNTGISLLNSNPLNFRINYYGQVKVSNSITSPKICISNQLKSLNNESYVTKIYNFNRANGTISSNHLLEINKSIISCEFSTDDNLLYASMDIVGNRNPNDYRLVVFDINNQILGYRVLTNNPITGNLQRAIDGNIYFTNKIEPTKLFKINNQNSWSTSSISSQIIDFGSYKTTMDLPQLIPFVPVSETLNCPELTLNTETNTGSIVYQNYSSITTQTNYNLTLSTQDVTLKAKDFIKLKPNTHIKSGSKLLAKIQPCTITQNKTSDLEEEKNNELIKSYLDITMYPNPSNSNITFNYKLERINKITIFSLDGKQVINQLLNNLNEYQLNISNLENGIYLVNIETKEGKRHTQKLIKN